MKRVNPKIVIIGGGVIGTSIAYHLSRYNADVTLLEKGDLASGSSGACDGLMLMQSKKPGIHLALALESLSRFSSLASELPVDIEFRKTGGMVIIETDAEYRSMEKYVCRQQEIGLDVRILDREETLEKEPCLSSKIQGCTFCPWMPR